MGEDDAASVVAAGFDDRMIDRLAWCGIRARPPEETFVRFITALRDEGMPIDRADMGYWLLHPRMRGRELRWTPDEGLVDHTLTFESRHQPPDGDFLGDPARGGPSRLMLDTGLPGHYWRLDRPLPPEVAVLGGLAAQGFIGFIGIGRPFYSMRNPPPLAKRRGAFLGLATKASGGFVPDQFNRVGRLANLLAGALRAGINEEIAEVLLTTYIGRRSGRRVLEGKIHRGDGEDIEAVIWFSDLRGFTPLTEGLPPKQLLELLNAYFELVSAAVTAHGGEVLRFIGDAMLIIFPVDEAMDRAKACAAALDAVAAAAARAVEVNRDRDIPIDFGVGLTLGLVTYGNVGAPDRLDFTVMGPQVNLAARLESQTKSVGRKLLFTRAVADLAGRPVESLGLHSLKGIVEPVEVCSLAGPGWRSATAVAADRLADLAALGEF